MVAFKRLYLFFPSLVWLNWPVLTEALSLFACALGFYVPQAIWCSSPLLFVTEIHMHSLAHAHTHRTHMDASFCSPQPCLAAMFLFLLRSRTLCFVISLSFWGRYCFISQCVDLCVRWAGRPSPCFPCKRSVSRRWSCVDQMSRIDWQLIFIKVTVGDGGGGGEARASLRILHYLPRLVIHCPVV